MDTTTIGLIVIPVVIFVLGGIYGAVRGIVRFAQYFVRAEEAQHGMSESMDAMHKTLSAYIEKNDHRLNSVDRRLSILEYALSKVLPDHEVRRTERERNREEIQ